IQDQYRKTRVHFNGVPRPFSVGRKCRRSTMHAWWVAVLGTVIAISATAATLSSEAHEVKGTDGKTLGVVLVCSDCKSTASTSKKRCLTGVEHGWLNGKRCGQCMINANYGAPLVYPYDLHFTGKLTDPAGQPVKNRFVKLFMANGWSVRTRTSPEGTFRLMLGATAPRKSKRPLVTDLGTRMDSPEDHKAYYALFFLPDPYKPCPTSTATKPAAKHK
ncbi:MAG: hypothetical protein ACE5I7_12255, partial [Candidatus Binatia bacterium]